MQLAAAINGPSSKIDPQLRNLVSRRQRVTDLDDAVHDTGGTQFFGGAVHDRGLVRGDAALGSPPHPS